MADNNNINNITTNETVQQAVQNPTPDSSSTSTSAPAASATQVTSSTFTLTSVAERTSVKYDTQEDMLVLSTITAPLYVQADRESRASVDVVAVVDRSGSMRGEKLKLVCKTLKFVVQVGVLKMECKASLTLSAT